MWILHLYYFPLEPSVRRLIGGWWYYTGLIADLILYAAITYVWSAAATSASDNRTLGNSTILLVWMVLKFCQMCFKVRADYIEAVYGQGRLGMGCDLGGLGVFLSFCYGMILCFLVSYFFYDFDTLDNGLQALDLVLVIYEFLSAVIMAFVIWRVNPEDLLYV